MNRRFFLKLIGQGAVGAAVGASVLDPEKLLWVPGAKRIFDLGAHPAYLTIEMIQAEALKVLQDVTSLMAGLEPLPCTVGGPKFDSNGHLMDALRYMQGEQYPNWITAAEVKSLGGKEGDVLYAPQGRFIVGPIDKQRMVHELQTAKRQVLPYEPDLMPRRYFEGGYRGGKTDRALDRFFDVLDLKVKT